MERPADRQMVCGFHLTHGFRIGFQGEAGVKLRSRMKNMVSVMFREPHSGVGILR
jgi:hypothetical protein